jgi:regulator of PEP synthase PpsR (kinase-PPPase family)
MTRDVFFVSDGTGITAETLGNTLLTQFSGEFVRHRIPFVSDTELARAAVTQIQSVADSSEARPIVFSTALLPQVRDILLTADALVIDLFEQNLGALELELSQKAIRHTGKAHGMADLDRYRHRISAVEFAIEHDDGQSLRALAMADVILIAPSRCGKTPTTMYLALHHGVRSANYPLLEEELREGRIPDALLPFRDRLFGLTSTASRLHQVREERRPGSPYASMAQCRFELAAATRIYEKFGIPFVDSANRSIEEIATVLMRELKLG